MIGNKNSAKKPKSIICELCDYKCYYKSDLDKHFLTAKHLKNIEIQDLETVCPQKTRQSYVCESCYYNTSSKKDYDKHNSTQKHLGSIKMICPKKIPKYVCNFCNKEYANNSGLYKHKQKCNSNKETENELREQNTEKPTLTIDLFLDLIKQNKELQDSLKESHNKIIELSQHTSTTMTNCNNNNINNQQFNLQFFLNETCKDAMNIKDFIDSIQVSMEDFENTGKLGFIEGISRIIINSLNQVDTTKRPIHCTDIKRETLYIKDNNMWEKEEKDKIKLKNAVNKIASKNFHQLPIWQKNHPDSILLDSTDNQNYMQYAKSAIGSVIDEEQNKFTDKIVRNVLKNVTICKEP